jgi:hypothetical protein
MVTQPCPSCLGTEPRWENPGRFSPGLRIVCAERTTPARGALLKRLRDLIVQACEADDLDLISQALILGPREQVTKLAFPRVFSRNAPKVLNYLLIYGSDTDIENIAGKAATHIALAAYEQAFPKSLVQILLDDGWDINYRDRNRDQPLLWKMVHDGDAVAWCLERGASVLPKGQKLWINNAEAYAEYFERCPFSSEERSDCLYYYPQILQLAARESTVATFELLRSKGVPLG